MTQFTEFQQKVEHAVKQCLSSAKQYRETNNVSEAPLELIQSSVTQHLSPLGGADNVLKIVIIEGKSDWRKSAFDLVFRRTLLAGLLKVFFIIIGNYTKLKLNN
jgi:hypothetical protein